jgi:hypothetical protein
MSKIGSARRRVRRAFLEFRDKALGICWLPDALSIVRDDLSALRAIAVAKRRRGVEVKFGVFDAPAGAIGAAWGFGWGSPNAFLG